MSYCKVNKYINVGSYIEDHFSWWKKQQQLKQDNKQLMYTCSNAERMCKLKGTHERVCKNLALINNLINLAVGYQDMYPDEIEVVNAGVFKSLDSWKRRHDG